MKNKNYYSKLSTSEVLPLLALIFVLSPINAIAQSQAPNLPPSSQPQNALPKAQPIAPAATPTATPVPVTSATATEETVVVTGVRDGNRIDRQTTDLKNDIAAQSGTAADALNRVPSVNVDSEGNVSLRGNSNVQILINGRATAQTRGENRAATMLSMAGADIESVEVMNNPGAAFSSEGSGGVINLVMRRNRRPGKYLTIIANAGPKDRQNINLAGAYNKDGLNITGSFGIRNDGRSFKSSSETVRLLAPIGTTSRTIQTGATENRREGYNASLSVDYTINDKDTIGITGNYADRTFSSDTQFHYKGYNNTNALLRDYNYASLSEQPREERGFGINFEHKGKLQGETFKTDFKYSNTKGLGGSNNSFDYIFPITPRILERKTRAADDTNWIYSVDYNRPINGSIITTGAQVTIDDNKSKSTAVSIDTLGNITIIPNQNRSFNSYQKVAAAYFTYQRGFGEKWTAQAGVRVENTDINVIDPVSQIGSSSLYTNVNPSAFASYILNDNAKIRASYSRRIQRPAAQDLNPIVVVNSAESISIGNPNLKPQTTDSFELGYEYSKQRLNYQIRGYYRLNDNIITSYTRLLAGNILETSRINGGQSQTAGIEANFSNRLYDKLTVNLNSNLSYVEQDSLVPGRKNISGASLAGRMNLDFAATTKDKVQFMIGTQGKQFMPQGYRTPMAMSMISYSHQFTPFASFVASMTDPFGLAKFKTVTDSESIYATSRQTMEARTYYVGFRVIIGTRPANMRPEEGMRMPGGPGGPGPGMRPPGL